MYAPIPYFFYFKQFGVIEELSRSLQKLGKHNVSSFAAACMGSKKCFVAADLCFQSLFSFIIILNAKLWMHGI